MSDMLKYYQGDYIDIIYKKANTDDIDSIVQMQHKLNEMLGLYEDVESKDFIEYLKSSISNEEITYYVVKIAKETIGIVCIDFSDYLEFDGVEYVASIPLIYVENKYRSGNIAYNLFKLALKDIKNRGYNSFVMLVEDNNPNKYLHFSIADKLIDERKENIKDGGQVSQFLLGVSDIIDIEKLSFKDFIRKAVYTKRNFNKVLQELLDDTNNIYKKY